MTIYIWYLYPGESNLTGVFAFMAYRYQITLSEKEVQDNLDVLEDFCAQRGWEVVYSNKKEDRYYDKRIILYNNRKPEILYYLFLHELGHLWMIECDFTYPDRYPELAKHRPRYATVTYKIAKVQEEIEAWDVGRRIATSLGLRINEAKFEKIRAQCLMSYMSWAGKRKNNGSTEYNIPEGFSGIVEATGRSERRHGTVLQVRSNETVRRGREPDLSGQEPKKHPDES